MYEVAYDGREAGWRDPRVINREHFEVLTLGRLTICVGQIQVGLGRAHEILDKGFDAFGALTGASARFIVERGHPPNSVGDGVFGYARDDPFNDFSLIRGASESKGSMITFPR